MHSCERALVACVRARVRAWVRAKLRACVLGCVPACVLRCAHACLVTCVRAYLGACSRSRKSARANSRKSARACVQLTEKQLGSHFHMRSRNRKKLSDSLVSSLKMRLRISIKGGQSWFVGHAFAKTSFIFMQSRRHLNSHSINLTTHFIVDFLTPRG